MPVLSPLETAPPLRVPTLHGGVWDLSQAATDGLFMIVFYRGFHCSSCRQYLESLNRLLPEFERRGVAVVAVSGDSQDRAELTFDNWDIGRLRICYGMKLSSMLEWGLFIARSNELNEPTVFAEPGLFLLRPDRRIDLAILNSRPVLRPRWMDVLKEIDHHQPESQIQPDRLV